MQKTFSKTDNILGIVLDISTPIVSLHSPTVFERLCYFGFCKEHWDSASPAWSHTDNETSLEVSSSATDAHGYGCGRLCSTHQCNFNPLSGSWEESFSCFLTSYSLKFPSLPILGLGKMWERNSWFSGETTNFQKEAFPASPRSSRRAPRGADVLQGKPLDLASNCHLPALLGFPGGSDVKASACNAGDLGSIPGSGRAPGEGNGNPLQYSCLENPMEGGAW